MKWREGGIRDGAQDGETCDDLKTARFFRALVEAAGEQRPEGYPKGCRGKKIAAEVAPRSESSDLTSPSLCPPHTRSRFAWSHRLRDAD